VSPTSAETLGIPDVRGLGTTVLLCDADGNLFPSEEPAFVASAGVTNTFLVSFGVERVFTAEELRVAITAKNFRTTAVDLAVAHGVPVMADVHCVGRLDPHRQGGRPRRLACAG
jgi:hypothetical protein